MMTKKQLTALLKGMCAKSGHRTIYSNGKEVVYIKYERKMPCLTTTINEER